MNTFLSQSQIQKLLDLTKLVAKNIMELYNSDYYINIKNDSSPVTQADINASKLLEKELPNIANFPVLSEENTPNDNNWINWDKYWIIDPIDGTKHFINGSGEFCICIALIVDNVAIFGLIYAPTKDTAWFSQKSDNRVYKLLYNDITEIYNSSDFIRHKTVASLSSSSLTDKMANLLSVFPDFSWYSKGSALKYVDIIEGKATLYPKMWGTCEWDSAAGQCLLECSGGSVINFSTGEPLRYGYKKSLLNPHFLAYKGLSKKEIGSLLLKYKYIHANIIN